MNDPRRRQIETEGEARLAGRAAADLAGRFEEARSSGAMDGAVYPAPAEERGVGGIDDGVDREGGDIRLDDLDPVGHRHFSVSIMSSGKITAALEFDVQRP
jgi:hypothetical protein